MSGSIAQKLRAGIIDKLKEFDCFIDNDLPEYIMVLIANKKSSAQMKDDLGIFITDHVDEFVDWLHYCLDQIKLGNDPFVKSETKTVSKNEPAKVVKKEEVKIVASSSSSSSKPTTTTNEDYKENTTEKTQKAQAPVRTRKEITFTNEDKIKFNNDDKKKIENTNDNNDHHVIKNEKSASNKHKRIVYSDEQDNQPTKRIRNEISVKSIPIDRQHESNDKLVNRQAKNLQSQITNNYKSPSQLQQQQQQQLNNNLRTTKSSISHSQLNQKNLATTASSHQANSQLAARNSTASTVSYIKKSYVSSPSNHHNLTNYNQNYSTSQSSYSIRQINQQKQNELKNKSPPPSSIVHKTIVKKEVKNLRPNSMVMKAIEAANKQSNLPGISLRSKDESSPKSLVNRLGAGPSTTTTTDHSTSSNLLKVSSPIKQEDDKQRKEKRIAKFSFKNEIKKQVIEVIQPACVKEQKNEINVSNYLSKADLRVTLDIKKKLKLDESNIQIISDSKSKSEIEEEKELIILKNQIKPKKVLTESKKDTENKNDGKKQEVVDASKNEKRELLEKLKELEAKRKKLEQSVVSKDSNSSTATQSKKERCHFWPLCTNQDCKYHHPKAFCLQFPNCKFGANCLNIHPNCKFDSKCINPLCPFTHFSRKLVSQPKFKLLSTIQKIQPVKK